MFCINRYFKRENNWIYFKIKKQKQNYSSFFKKHFLNDNVIIKLMFQDFDVNVYNY